MNLLYFMVRAHPPRAYIGEGSVAGEGCFAARSLSVSSLVHRIAMKPEQKKYIPSHTRTYRVTCVKTQSPIFSSKRQHAPHSPSMAGVVEASHLRGRSVDAVTGILESLQQLPPDGSIANGVETGEI